MDWKSLGWGPMVVLTLVWQINQVAVAQDDVSPAPDYTVDASGVPLALLVNVKFYQAGMDGGGSGNFNSPKEISQFMEATAVLSFEPFDTQNPPKEIIARIDERTPDERIDHSTLVRRFFVDRAGIVAAFKRLQSSLGLVAVDYDGNGMWKLATAPSQLHVEIYPNTARDPKLVFPFSTLDLETEPETDSKTGLDFRVKHIRDRVAIGDVSDRVFTLPEYLVNLEKLPGEKNIFFVQLPNGQHLPISIAAYAGTHTKKQHDSQPDDVYMGFEKAEKAAFIVLRRDLELGLLQPKIYRIPANLIEFTTQTQTEQLLKEARHMDQTYIDRFLEPFLSKESVNIHSSTLPQRMAEILGQIKHTHCRELVATLVKTPGHLQVPVASK